MNQHIDLATQVKTWRVEVGLPTAKAAVILGIPKRTLDGIEQGRPFRYEQMLRLALKAAKEEA